jgi:hypothetical protein
MYQLVKAPRVLSLLWETLVGLNFYIFTSLPVQHVIVCYAAYVTLHVLIGTFALYDSYVSMTALPLLVLWQNA